MNPFKNHNHCFERSRVLEFLGRSTIKWAGASHEHEAECLDVEAVISSRREGQREERLLDYTCVCVGETNYVRYHGCRCFASREPTKN